MVRAICERRRASEDSLPLQAMRVGHELQEMGFVDTSWILEEDGSVVKQFPLRTEVYDFSVQYCTPPLAHSVEEPTKFHATVSRRQQRSGKSSRCIYVHIIVLYGHKQV